MQHSTGGYLLGAVLTMKRTFDIRPDDVFWCTADIGWITGHTYITYGPTAVGATQIVFEGVPTYPHAGRFWEMIQRHKATIFYTAPTAIRSLVKVAEADISSHPKCFDLSSLRILGIVGEPINPETWVWYREHVGAGRYPVIDKTRLGKIMRRLLRSLAKGESLTQDVSTLENPSILDQFGTAA